MCLGCSCNGSNCAVLVIMSGGRGTHYRSGGQIEFIGQHPPGLHAMDGHRRPGVWDNETLTSHRVSE